VLIIHFRHLVLSLSRKEKLDWGGLWLPGWSAVVGRWGQFAIAFRGSGRRNACRLMFQFTKPAARPPAHELCECSRPIFRTVLTSRSGRDVSKIFGKKCAHKTMYWLKTTQVCTIDNKYANMCTLIILCTLCTPSACCAHYVHTVHTGCSASQLMRRAEFHVFFYSHAIHPTSSTLCSRKTLKAFLK
jgi:hypothetical protein